MVFVRSVAFLAAFRMQRICFVVSALGAGRHLSPSHSWFHYGKFLLCCGFRDTLAVGHKGLSVVFLDGLGFDDVCIAHFAGASPQIRVRWGRFLFVSFRRLLLDFGYWWEMRRAKARPSAG